MAHGVQVQQLQSKAKHIEVGGDIDHCAQLLLLNLCVQRLGGYSDIKWHFIGHLQRKKTKVLMGMQQYPVIISFIASSPPPPPKMFLVCGWWRLLTL